MDTKAGSKAQIWAAVIAAIAAIVVALIGVFFQNKDRRMTSEEIKPGVDAPAEPAIKQASVGLALTAVLIGERTNSKSVEKVRTTFSEKEPIAITVRYNASESVGRFPVRLGISLGNPLFGDRQYTQVADISRPGVGEHTFFIRPEQPWVSGQQLLQIALDDKKAYSKMITIERVSD